MTGTPPITGPIGQTVIERGARDNLYLHFAIQRPNAEWMGDELLKLVNLSGSDAISDHFQYQLELRGNSDPAYQNTPNIELLFEALMGQPITVAINQPSARGAKGSPPAEKPYTRKESCALFLEAVTGKWPGEEPVDEQFTFFNGIVTAFAMSEPGVYQLTMRPAAWKATLTNRYRIHTQKNIRDAIAEVLKEHAIDFTMDAVSGDDNPAKYRVQDWLQAGESDYDFIHRLMGKAHLYYYYRHEAGRHTLFFANRPDYAAVYPNGHKLRYAFTNEDALAMEQEDLITQYRYERTLTASGVTSTLSRQQAAWEDDSVAGDTGISTVVPTYTEVTNQARDKSHPGELPFHRFQILQYGGSQEEVTWETKNTAHRLATSATGLSGASHCARFRAGHQFQMADSSSPDLNPTAIRPTLPTSPFVLTCVQHKASLDGGYSNQFQATEADGLVTPFDIHDTQQGSVLAKVVSHQSTTSPPKGWKFYYRNNFDPEQGRWRDPHSPDPEDHRQFRPEGVYVKFATDTDADDPRWVKLAAHMQTAPEIGVTVTVSRSYFADELPEIQSIVQSNGNKTVTPCGWTASTNVGSNYSTSYGDSKSVRFGLKSPPTQLLVKQAKAIVESEYTEGVYRDVSYSQGASFSHSTSEHGRSGILSKSHSYGSTYSRHEGDESKSWSDITTSHNESKVGIQTSTSEVGVSTSHSDIGTSTSNSNIGTSQSLNIVGTSHSVSTTGLSTSHSATKTSISYSKIGLSKSSSHIVTSKSSSKIGLQESDNDITTSKSTTKGILHESSSDIATSKSTTRGVLHESSSDIATSRSTTKIGLQENDSDIATSKSTTKGLLHESHNDIATTKSNTKALEQHIDDDIAKLYKNGKHVSKDEDVDCATNTTKNNVGTHKDTSTVGTASLVITTATLDLTETASSGTSTRNQTGVSSTENKGTVTMMISATLTIM